jgi:hypothetical protein
MDILLFLLGALLLLGCTGAVVAGVFLWIRHVKGQRRAGLASLADRIGFRYVAPKSQGLQDRLRAAMAMPNVSQYGMHGPWVLDDVAHIEGTADGSVLRLGNTPGRGEGSDDVTLATAEDPRLDLPTFGVTPRTPLGVPPGAAMAFPEDPEFASRFWVCGPDPEAVRVRLQPAIRRELLSRGYFFLEGYGHTCAVTREGIEDGAGAEALLDDLKVFLRLLIAR